MLEADVLQAGKEKQPVLHHIIGLQEEDEIKGLAVSLWWKFSLQKLLLTLPS